MKQIMINSCYLFCFAFMLFSCTRNINSLDKQIVSFNELPLPVQDTLIVLARENEFMWFILFEQDRYDTKDLKWKRGPFTDGFMFIDNEKGKKYKINNGVPGPYIVYNNFLYRPVEFNILFENRIRNEMFVKSALK